MPGGDFLDSNVLIYAASGDAAKCGIAQSLIVPGAIVSVQVLNEFTSVMTRKHGYMLDEVRTFLAGVRGVAATIPLDVNTHDQAIRLAGRFRLQFWDALIAASALEAGCTRLFSEDMHAGLVIDGRLTIVNPFAAIA